MARFIANSTLCTTSCRTSIRATLINASVIFIFTRVADPRDADIALQLGKLVDRSVGSTFHFE